MSFKNNGMALLVAGVSSLVLSIPASAQEDAGIPTGNEGGFDFVLTAGLTIGGDDFVEIEDDNGDHVDDLEAGGLIYLGAGGHYRFANSPLSIQAVYAYHWDSVDADNGDATFDRFELDMILFYNNGPHRFGAGMTQHFGPSLDVDIDYGFNGDIDFDDATGVLIEYGYMFSAHGGIGVRYTDIEYDLSDISGESVDGSNVGLFITGFF